MIEVIEIFLIALISPLILIPIEKVLPFPYVIEEILKLTIVILIYKKEILLNKKLFFAVLISGFLFALSENVFYLINIFENGDLTFIPLRILLTGALHIGTISLIYFFGRKNNFYLLISLLMAITIHYFYNFWVIRFF